MKLLIIADDFTGALDTGVQFAARGASTLVVVDPEFPMEQADAQVLIVDAETRHLTAQAAYQVVFGVVQRALAAGFTHIYKKTDSALRGNVGAELTAVMDAAGQTRIAFLPALPKMNRITRGGIHYIDGVPVAQSVFGEDPFEPVTKSSVAEILHEGSDAPVVLHPLGSAVQMDAPGIHVYDAEHQQDLQSIGSALGSDGIRLSGGCAGFGTVVADMLLEDGQKPQMPKLNPGLFVACGSVNAVTLRQMAEAEKAGFRHIHLTPVQKLDAAWPESAACRKAVSDWLEEAKTGRCILDVNDPEGCDDTVTYSQVHGLDVEFRRQRISANLARLVKAMLDGGLEGTILCTGGDTLLALMKQVGVSQLIPVGELAPGAVLTRFRYQGKEYNIISKSGGFGAPDLFIKIANQEI